ncbi:MAG: glucosaminidase domain-containing protein, partial [Flavobacteriaceae bacterium]|nr:glucosaminidase domain-containing protein [Flavobacteriaceae bacterium]
MKKILLLVAIAMFGSISAQAPALTPQMKKDVQYVRNYAKFAVREMQLFKIPASITLAQGLLETGYGQSDLAQYGNNHFGIKCKNDWMGGRMYHDDDARGECFRKYPSASDSYRDHSLFLANRPYYKSLFYLDPKDYKAWAHGLKKSGYATNPKYAYTLIKSIEKYQLNLFDNVTEAQINDLLEKLYPDSSASPLSAGFSNSATVSDSNNSTQKSFASDIQKSENKLPATTKKISKIPENNFEFPAQRIKHHPNGNVKFIVSKDGDTWDDVSKAYGISFGKLLIYNDLDETNINLVPNQKIFLEPKRLSGAIQIHIAKKGDTMYDIAQNYAVSLEELYRKNLMKKGQ